MGKFKVYEYAKCGTCRKAFKYLDEKKVSYQKIPVRENPPSKAALKKMLKIYDGNIKKLMNTSGGDYREMKNEIAEMSEDQILTLLSERGNLVKRPFVISGNKGLVGFKEDEWGEFLK